MTCIAPSAGRKRPVFDDVAGRFGLGMPAISLFLGLVVVVLLVWVAVRLVPALATWRGRRLAYGRWRRLVHWEYWPWWIVYVPVAARVLLLGLRYRSCIDMNENWHRFPPIIQGS